MNIKKLFALVLALLLIISTFAGCRKIKNDDSYFSSTSSDVTINYGNVEIIDDESEPQSVVDIPSDIPSEPVVDDVPSTESSTPVQEPTQSTNPEGVEIFGAGSITEPYIETPNLETGVLKTFTIPANASLYYSVYRIVGRELTINNANAYVVYDGTKYSAVDGKVKFVVKEPKDYMPNSPVMLEIGNTGTEPVSFDLIFADVEGSWNQSASINITQKNTTHFDAGKEHSEIYYEYVAEKSGVLHFYFTETIDATDSFEFFVQNNTGATVQKNNSDDLTDATDDIYEVELSVNQGDHIKIYFSNVKKGRSFLETNIEWYAEYK